MTDLAVSNDTAWSATAKTRMGVVLAIWFALTALAGVTGAVAVGPDTLFRPIALTMVVPVLAFVALYLGSARFRDFVLGRDLRFLTLLQAWRVVGFAFLPLYAFGVLPGLFAWPAGVGDVLVGLTAPWVVFALLRDPAFAASRAFVVWNVLGLADFAVAGATSVLASGAVPGLVAGGVTSAPMELWPLMLFPSFLVPLFTIAHLTALFQVRALRRAGRVAGR
jgi:hypothetical protein